MLKQATMGSDLLYIISEFQITQIEIGFFFLNRVGRRTRLLIPL